MTTDPNAQFTHIPTTTTNRSPIHSQCGFSSTVHNALVPPGARRGTYELTSLYVAAVFDDVWCWHLA